MIRAAFLFETRVSLRHRASNWCRNLNAVVLTTDTRFAELLRFALAAAIVMPGRRSFVGSFSGRPGLQVRDVVMNRVLAFALVVSMAGTPSVFAAGAAQAPANSSMSGSVKNSSGRSIANATVRLRDLETGQLAGTTTSDAAGQFSFPGLAAGSFTVEIVNASGEIIGSSAPIAVAPGAAISGVVVSTTESSKKKGGAFFTSTAGLIAIAASGAAVAGVTAATRPTASGSK
jgi:carboxypeptidase family protein